MSFFGFDATRGPQDKAKSFFDSTADGEDAYDGLAEDLDQDYDDLNDETFGSAAEHVGRDFDFSRQTAVAAAALDRPSRYQSPIQVPPSRNSATQTPTAPAEQQIFTIPDLKPMESLWSSDLSPSSGATASATLSLNPAPTKPEPKKFLSLEEVEAQLKAAARPKSVQTQQQPQPLLQPQFQTHVKSPALAQSQAQPLQQPSYPLMQFQQQQFVGQTMPPFPMSTSFRPGPVNDQLSGQTQALDFQRGVPLPMPQIGGRTLPGEFSNSATTPLLNQAVQVGRQETSVSVRNSQDRQAVPIAPRNMQPSYQIIYPNQQHQIPLAPPKPLDPQAERLARFNGLMTPYEKNHITKLQLQQLVFEDPSAEDFYYQVHTALHGIKDGQAGASNREIAEKYLNEYGRQSRNGLRKQQESMQRIQQRAIAAAKAHPKHEHYVLEGALGKLTFASGNAPRKVLDVNKRPMEESKS
ncbi:topoisomerase II-associated protein PAT1 [Lipomyces oligophaga]|uniref:topoisomerase II-associated protein PAT1 n=1 Tax=Lipomyces oligophaga TaxID=45792 RepID=UPI0034CE3569